MYVREKYQFGVYNVILLSFLNNYNLYRREISELVFSHLVYIIYNISYINTYFFP